MKGPRIEYAIVGLESQVGEISELRRQREAPFKNADAARKQRNESQDTLITSQAENERLANTIETMTAEHEIAVLELDEYRTGFEKSRAVSVELNTVQAELNTPHTNYQRVAADNARLLLENGSIEEIKEKSRINQRLADDRLEERQEQETELRRAKVERKESKERAKKADEKAEEIKKNWHIAKNELLDVHRSNRELKFELKKHANCSGRDVVKNEQSA